MEYAVVYRDGEPQIHKADCCNIAHDEHVDNLEATEADEALFEAADQYAADLDCFDGRYPDPVAARDESVPVVRVQPCSTSRTNLAIEYRIRYNTRPARVGATTKSVRVVAPNLGEAFGVARAITEREGWHDAILSINTVQTRRFGEFTGNRGWHHI